MSQTTRTILFMGVCALSAMSATAECPILEADSAFVDAQGNWVDPTLVDAIAFVQSGDRVTVYQRNRSDADSLVSELRLSGEVDSELLKIDVWMAAAARTCSGDPGPGKKCKGVCPGTQLCKRIRKKGKDVCVYPPKMVFLSMNNNIL